MNSSLWWDRLGSNQRPADYEFGAGPLGDGVSNAGGDNCPRPTSPAWVLLPPLLSFL